MTMSRTRLAISLEVLWQGQPVGLLTNRETSGASIARTGSKAGPLTAPSKGWLQFGYDPQWLQKPDAEPLSLHLPLQEKPFDHWRSQAFFAGLLPSGALREAIAAQLGKAPDDDLALLDALGADCPGAISVRRTPITRQRWPLHLGGRSPESPPVPQLQLFDEAGSAKPPDADQALLQACGKIFLGRKAGMRSSWPGNGAVVPIWQEEGDDVSSHLLWMAPPGLDAALLQRAFCMELLQRLGIPVHPVQLSRTDAITTLLQLRPDRTVDDAGRVTSLPGETLGQALGLVPGATASRQATGWESCFALLRMHVQPSVLPVLQLLDMVIGFVLVGDANASPHRLRLQRQHGTWQIAPLWDACSTLAPVARGAEPARMAALPIGRHRGASPPPAAAWNAFARQCGLSPNQVRKRVRTLAQAMHAALPALLKDADLAKTWQHPAIRKLALHLRERAEHMARAE